MESCPLEICQRIFMLACTDGGRTGRSLSLVSRYVHDASAKARYHSVILTGREQLYAFASILERQPDLGNVHHLFMADHLQDGLVDYNLESFVWRPPLDREPRGGREILREGIDGGRRFGIWVPQEKANRARLAHQWLLWHRDEADRLAFWADDVLKVVSRILSAVAPTLRTLVLYLIPPTRFTLVPVHLPRLEELTCFFRGGMSDHPLPIQPLTSLRRLNLVTFGWDRMRQLPEAAPSLTHLRFSNGALGFSDLHFDYGFVPESFSDLAPFDKLFSPDIQAVLIQTDRANRQDTCTRVSREDAVLYLQRLSARELAISWHHLSSRERALVNGSDARYNHDDAKRDWLECVEGMR